MAQKERTPRNAKYLAYIRTYPCHRCGHPPGPGEIQATHVRKGSNAGMGQKPSDYLSIPFCARCHDRQHSIGETTFWSELGQDPNLEIVKYIAGYFPDRRRAVHLLETLIEHERGNKEAAENPP